MARRKLKLVKKPAKSTALAKTTDKYEELLQMMQTWQQQRVQVVNTAVERQLDERIALGELGLSEVKLTPEEEAVLARPVPAGEVQIKPQGQPYLSHPYYTKLFNEAFGRTGWTLVPASRPLKSDKSVVCPYVLFIHGVPVQFAMGEQDYYESNKEQSYGDAIESTVASALRRCAKHLGVAMELWDRAWLREWIDKYAVRVRVERKDGDEGKAWVWRRVSDPPFWNEVTQARQEPARSERVQRAVDKVLSKDPITDGQRRRMFAMLKPAGRDEMQFRGWLRLRYGYDSTKQITRDRYEEICQAIEAPGGWPGIDREPGEDDQ